MRSLQRLALLFLFVLSSVTSAAYANTCAVTANSFPILNLALNPNCVMTANFNFPKGTQVLYCAADSALPAAINWPYKGKTRSANMPTMLSRTGGDPRYLIDTQGQISIQNKQVRPILINCAFG